KAYTDMSGYSEQDVRGKDVRMMYTGFMSDETISAVIDSLDKTGHWQGEIWNQRKNGETYLEWLSVSAVFDQEGQLTHYVATTSDITQRKQDEERMHWLSHFDPLTGLPNRTLLEDRCRQAIRIAQSGGEPLALMFLDLDHFKNINETLGHRVGDMLLVELSNRLTFIAREQDTLSRMGGDDFVLVLPGINAAGAAHMAERVQAAIAHPFQIEEHELSISGSLGIAMYPIDGDDFDSLIKCADMAVYRAKQDGRNTFCFFTAEIQARTVRTLQLENALRRALERDQLMMYYQPQVSLADQRIVGAEALLRWQHPELGMVSPAEFIPIAENSGLILSIGEWAMRAATRQMNAWIDAGFGTMTMSVNLSAAQFRQPDLPQLVMQILEETGLPPEHFEIELTESVAMENPQAAIEVMDDLSRRGIRLSIDDFGTGYSSLAHLKRFQVYKLKIDRSFVIDVAENSEDRAIVRAIINLASSLGLRTIAEGVETEQQLAFLQQSGCHEIQGYYFSRPLTAEQFEVLLRTGYNSR
ncbi:MAG: EAL domain-containing protein, partial [Burkholderiaceae bacterium]|nr:EAL domain-containing protein [Burkholderiaceae bacterium]